jgi:hypothetical protein
VSTAATTAMRGAMERLIVTTAGMDVRARAAMIRGFRPTLDAAAQRVLMCLWPLLAGPQPDEIAQLVTEFIAVVATTSSEDRHCLVAGVLAADLAEAAPFDEVFFALAAAVSAIDAYVEQAGIG